MLLYYYAMNPRGVIVIVVLWPGNVLLVKLDLSLLTPKACGVCDHVLCIFYTYVHTYVCTYVCTFYPLYYVHFSFGKVRCRARAKKSKRVITMKPLRLPVAAQCAPLDGLP